MNYEQIDRIELKQLDVSTNSKEGKENLEKDLNSFIKGFEDSGLEVFGEDFLPELNGTRAIMNIYFKESNNVMPTKYSYIVVDSRNGHGVASRLINEELLKLKKEGNIIIRKLSIPKRNAAFSQILLVYIPSEKSIKEKKPIKEKPVEVVEDAREEKSSEAITA